MRCAMLKRDLKYIHKGLPQCKRRGKGPVSNIWGFEILERLPDVNFADQTPGLEYLSQGNAHADRWSLSAKNGMKPVVIQTIHSSHNGIV